MEKYCIGIDVDKRTFKVCLMFRDQDMKKKIKAAKAFSNTKEGFEQFTEWVEVRIKQGLGRGNMEWL